MEISAELKDHSIASQFHNLIPLIKTLWCECTVILGRVRGVDQR